MMENTVFWDYLLMEVGEENVKKKFLFSWWRATKSENIHFKYARHAPTDGTVMESGWHLYLWKLFAYTTISSENENKPDGFSRYVGITRQINILHYEILNTVVSI